MLSSYALINYITMYILNLEKNQLEKGVLVCGEVGVSDIDVLLFRIAFSKSNIYELISSSNS